MRLEEFNALPAAEAAAHVAVWAAIPEWVGRIVGSRPFASVDAVAEVADAASRTWTRDELDAAMAHHPRIGERPTGAGAEIAASRREQASMAAAGDEMTAEIAQANADYERRFGRVFLVRAAGRTPAELLAEARRRLGNDDDAEIAEALDQLRQIALLRLRGALEA